MGSNILNHKLNSLLLMQNCTFLLSDEVLDDDVSHAVSISITILVEAMNSAEGKLVAGNGPILAAQHLDKRRQCSRTSINTSKKRQREWENVPVVKASRQPC